MYITFAHYCLLKNGNKYIYSIKKFKEKPKDFKDYVCV